MSAGDAGRFRARARLTLAVLVGGLAMVAARAFKLQVERHDQLSRVARDEYLSELRIPARRGTIYDRSSKPLAISVDVPSVYANPSIIHDPRAAARRLAPALGLDLDTVYQRLASDRYFVWLERQVSPATAERVEALGIKGVDVVKEPRRFYPNRELGAHVIGFAGVDARGLEGIERALDEDLTGEPQVVRGLRDARGKALFAGEFDPERRFDGGDVVLTLDSRIQHSAQIALRRERNASHAKAATAVVLDVPTAEVLAMAVEPTFNPNEGSKADAATRRNRAVTDMFEPGSTLKPLVVAAALDAGVVRPDTTIFCENGSIRIGNDIIRDTSRHGTLSLTEIIAKSSNIGAAKIGRALGRARLAAALRAYGIGSRTGIRFPGETPGALRDPSTWSDVGLATISYGHGVAVSALQLAAAYRVLAAGGRYRAPTLVKAIERADGRVETPPDPIERRVLHPESARRLVAMMEEVVSTEGTGLRAAVPGYRVAGKTGTAEKVDSVAGGYSDDRVVAVFAGFLPAEAPRVVIVVAVDEPQGLHSGGSVAAPVFAEIGEAAMRYLGVVPTLPLTADAEQPEVATELAREAERSESTLGMPAEQPAAGGESGMPSFVGLTAREVVARFTEMGTRLELEMQGSGRVVEQHPAPGSGLAGTRRVSVVLAAQQP